MLALRYDRQARIDGWDQEKIATLRVGVIGGDYGAYYTLLPLVAMGVGERGEIRILSNNLNRIKLLDARIYIPDDLISILSKVNPLISKSIRFLRVDLIRRELTVFLRNLDVIIDTTNNPTSKAIAAEYAVKNNIRYISFSTMPCYGRLEFVWDNINENKPRLKDLDYPFFLPEFRSAQQEELMSILFGGFAASFISNYAAGKKQGQGRIIYNLLSSDRLSLPNISDYTKFIIKYIYKIPSSIDFSNFRVVMIGAGALGNPVAIALAKIRIGELIIIDYDRVEETNLNRQYCYYDSVNEYKAKALAEKVKIMSGMETKAVPVIEEFNLDKVLNGKLRKYFEKADLILALVDNFDARADAADLAEILKKPLIIGGTSPFSGHMAIYIPGKTPNLNDLMKYREHAEKTDRLRCIEVREPSVVTSNQVIGGLIALEILKVLRPDIYGEPSLRPIHFYSYMGGRLEV